MNNSEQKAFEWLKKQGYKDNEIIFRRRDTPDFICSDNTRFEVKFLYKDKIIFHGKQFEQMQDNDYVLVFDRDKFVRKFKWKDRDKMPFSINLVSPNRKSVLVSDQTWKDLTLLRLDFGVRTYAKAIEELIKTQKENTHDRQ